MPTTGMISNDSWVYSDDVEQSTLSDCRALLEFLFRCYVDPTRLDTIRPKIKRCENFSFFQFCFTQPSSSVLCQRPNWGESPLRCNKEKEMLPFTAAADDECNICKYCTAEMCTHNILLAIEDVFVTRFSLS